MHNFIPGQSNWYCFTYSASAPHLGNLDCTSFAELSVLKLDFTVLSCQMIQQLTCILGCRTGFFNYQPRAMCSLPYVFSEPFDH
uniref:Uncharacterized protein n=1 Tax=Anguilla anguilla TaxID=7936 RepID=A0A0E9RBA9_ANGAN